MRLVAGLFVIGAVAAVGFLTFTDSYYLECRECHSIEDVREWRFGRGQGESIQLLPSRRTLEESVIRRDFFDAAHSHVWEPGAVAGTRVFFGLVQGTISCDGSIPHQFVRKCDDPGFRRFLRDKVASGRLSRQHLIRLFTTTDHERVGHVRDPLEAERAALLEGYAIGG